MLNSNDPVHLGQPGYMPGDDETAEVAPLGWLCCKCKHACVAVELPDAPLFKNSKCCDAPAARVWPWDLEARLFLTEEEPASESEALGLQRGSFDVVSYSGNNIAHYRYWDEQSYREAEAKARICSVSYARSEVRQRTV